MQKSRERKRQGLFVAEGFREVQLAINNGFQPETLFFDESQTGLPEVEKLLHASNLTTTELISVSPEVMEKIAYRSTVSNVVGLFKSTENSLSEIILPERPLVLVSESVEKPGNLGAILRTADAAGVDAVIVCDPQVDIYNPNTIRASLGAVFALPVIGATSEETLAWLRKNNISIMSTYLEASVSLFQCDLTGPSALVLGAESTGITPFWVENADTRVIIPMSGQIDSLNVSASAAIVLFEAVRQRSIGQPY